MGKDVELGLDNIGIALDLDGNMTMDSNVDLNMGRLDNIRIDMGLDDMKMDMKTESKVDMGLDDVNICMNLAFKEVPNIKIHMPVNYEFGFEFLGFKLFNFCLGGKSMIVTEDNPTRMFYKKTQTKRTNSTNQPGFKVSIEEK